MSHPLQLRYESEAVSLRASQLFVELKELEAAGAITTRAGFLQEFYQRLRTFYESIDRPLFQVREADLLPSSADYNDMIAELRKDLEIVYLEAGQIRRELDIGFQESEIDRTILDERMRRAESRMNELISDREAGEVVFHDGFLDDSLRDKTRGTDHAAHTWTREGVLTLQPRSAKSHIEGATVRIHSGNGLPGNTKQAKATAGEIRFVGEEALHLNLADLLDGNADTWFEYEHFRLAKETVDELRGLGLGYREGVKWASDRDEPLKLTLEIELPKAESVNWFSLHPFLPSESGTKAAQLSALEIHDGQGGVFRPLKEEEGLDSEKVYLFGRQLCKRIVVEFTQPHDYVTEVGHVYYQEIETQTLNYLERMKEKPGKRVDGQQPPLSALGLGYDPAAGEVTYPLVTKDFGFKELDDMKQSLFELPSVDEADELRIRNGLELVPANRQAIGLRDIGLAHYEFEKSSEYISLPFRTDREFVAVSLVTVAEAPADFPPGEWIRYWISPDDGANWYRIHPRTTTSDHAVLLYLFNTQTPVEGRVSHFGYVDLAEPVKSLRLRIEMERPDGTPDSEFYTPLLKDYELHAVLGGA